MASTFSTKKVASCSISHLYVSINRGQSAYHLSRHGYFHHGAKEAAKHQAEANHMEDQNIFNIGL